MECANSWPHAVEAIAGLAALCFAVWILFKD